MVIVPEWNPKAKTVDSCDGCLSEFLLVDLAGISIGVAAAIWFGAENRRFECVGVLVLGWVLWYIVLKKRQVARQEALAQALDVQPQRSSSQLQEDYYVQPKFYESESGDDLAAFDDSYLQRKRIQNLLSSSRFLLSPCPSRNQESRTASRSTVS